MIADGLGVAGNSADEAIPEGSEVQDAQHAVLIVVRIALVSAQVIIGVVLVGIRSRNTVVSRIG